MSGLKYLNPRYLLPKKNGLESYLENMRAFHVADAIKLHDHLYLCLSIIDTKSSGLNSINALMFAGSSFLFNKGFLGDFVFFLVGLLLLTSVLLLLMNIWIEWSNPQTLSDRQTQELYLLSVRRYRTIRFRWAWIFTSVAVLVLFCRFVAAALG